MIKITNEGLFLSMYGEEVLREQIMTDILENPKLNDVQDDELDEMVENEVRKHMKKIKDSELSHHMGDLVEFSDGLTFSRVFELIIKNKDIFNNIFKTNLNGVTIDDFIADFKKKPSKKKKIPITLLIFWYCVYDSYMSTDDDEEEEFTVIHEIPTFGGVDLGQDAKITKEAVDIALSYASLSDLKDYTIRMDGSIQFAKYDGGTEAPKLIFACDVKFFTLFDLIGGILDEVTAKGKPDERDEKKKMLEEKMKELNKSMKKKSKDTVDIDASSIINGVKNHIIDGNLKSTKSLDSMKIEELIEEQEKAAEDENYEKAAKIRDIIKKKQKLI